MNIEPAPLIDMGNDAARDVVLHIPEYSASSLENPAYVVPDDVETGYENESQGC
jgi:hypothetical protein